jgi:hypothetical protein
MRILASCACICSFHYNTLPRDYRGLYTVLLYSLTFHNASVGLEVCASPLPHFSFPCFSCCVYVSVEKREDQDNKKREEGEREGEGEGAREKREGEGEEERERARATEGQRDREERETA